MEKCIYDQWVDGDITSPSNFTHLLCRAFQVADGMNRSILIKAFPVFFAGSVNI